MGKKELGALDEVIKKLIAPFKKKTLDQNLVFALLTRAQYLSIKNFTLNMCLNATLNFLIFKTIPDIYGYY